MVRFGRFRSKYVLLALGAVGAAVVAACGSNPSSSAGNATATPSPTPRLGPPNVVIILADDLGWGDTATYGNPIIKTPNLDAMAKDGIKLNAFYVSSPVCAPSRGALMTGRYPPRNGILWNPPTRLNDGELTIADLLHAQGYATGMVGKWHLGWVPADFPNHHGFEFYYGIAAGEDALVGPGRGGAGFFEGDQLGVDPQPTNDVVGLDLLTRHYTDRAIEWMKSVPKGQPFFLYLSHRSPHLDLYVTAPFAGQSPYGPYGDVVQELDFTVGEVRQALKDMGVENNTLVFFTSDNGPQPPLGSPGPFNGHKSETQEGGVREPGLAVWPARIPAGRVVDEAVGTVDLLPTVLAMAGGTLPNDRVYDGMDVTPLLTGAVDKLPGNGIDGHRELLFWLTANPVAIRSGKWKYTRTTPWNANGPQLFDLESDPGEVFDVLRENRDVAATLDAHIDALANRRH